MKNGRRYHHILDPATGEPARGARSVTIVSNLAVLADGLSTGVFIMGPDAGMALIERLPDVEGGDRVGQERGADIVGAARQSQDRGAAN